MRARSKRTNGKVTGFKFEHPFGKFIYNRWNAHDNPIYSTQLISIIYEIRKRASQFYEKAENHNWRRVEKGKKKQKNIHHNHFIFIYFLSAWMWFWMRARCWCFHFFLHFALVELLVQQFAMVHFESESIQQLGKCKIECDANVIKTNDLHFNFMDYAFFSFSFSLIFRLGWFCVRHWQTYTLFE